MIMKTMKIFAAMMASVLAFSCVQKDEIVPQAGSDNKINLTIQVDYPQTDAMTKVVFDNQEVPQLQWTGDETLALLVGKSNTTTKASDGLQIPLKSIAPGVFSGEVDLGEFTLEDIQGVAVPAEGGTFFGYNNSANRINMPIPAEQTQTVNGVFNPLYVPFFAKFTKENLGVADSDGAYKIGGVELSHGTDLVQMNVYGKHADMLDTEVLKSVKIVTNNRITGEARWTITDDLTNTGLGSSSTGPAYVQVNFEGNETIADKTKDNGVKLYASVVLGGTRTFTNVEVTTDKATYTKDISQSIGPATNRLVFNVHRIGLNLSTFERVVVGGEEYSVDGGNTWVGQMPASLNGKLAVRTSEGTAFSSETLKAIKSLIDASAEPVTLDLSGAEYEDDNFPDLFKATAETPNTTLKSIKFPSNVTAIAAKAFQYCKALESVDLSTLATLGDYAFGNTGLVNLVVDSNITSLGKNTFENCFDLETLYFNANDPLFKNFGNSNRVDFYTFRFSSEVEPTKNLVATIGPFVQLPRYCFRQNSNLRKIIFEYNGEEDLRIGNNSLLRTFYLETIICKSEEGGCIYCSDGLTYIGTKLPEGTAKYIVVPDGCLDDYSKMMESGINETSTSGWAYLGFQLIEQSAYDALGK